MGFKLILNIYSILPNIKNIFSFINCKNIKLIYNFKFLFKKKILHQNLLYYMLFLHSLTLGTQIG